ncbi:MAG: ABC transporter ATP-binding protein [Lachnospiraceae bacterium]|nr:ABC transporter ATP-binding protein [Lachnospiraceae bacterium]
MKLELNQVVKKYDGFQLDCTLTVEEGCVTGLIGRNGAGKSTAFKAALGLIRMNAGTITLDGKDITKLSPKEKENVGVVLSDSGFNGILTIKDIIVIMKNTYRKFQKEAFENHCKQFSLPLNKPVKEFSTGMKAKLKVLLAMSYEAKLLILDEPTAGLDVVARDEILDMLREYMENEENSILISSHISSDLEGLCDDVYMIDNGKIVLHEETNVLLDAYGVLKVTKEQYEKLDKSYIVSRKKESYGYSLLTSEKQYYVENYPDITVEKSGIDQIITLLISGTREGDMV